MKAQMMFGSHFGWKEVTEELLMFFCLLANSSGSPASCRNVFKHTYTSMSAFQLRSCGMIRSFVKDCKKKLKSGIVYQSWVAEPLYIVPFQRRSSNKKLRDDGELKSRLEQHHDTSRTDRWISARPKPVAWVKCSSINKISDVAIPLLK